MKTIRLLIIFAVLLTLIISTSAFAKNDNQNYYRPIPMVVHDTGDGGPDYEKHHEYCVSPFIVGNEPLPELYWDPEDVQSPKIGNLIFPRLYSEEGIYLGPEVSGYDHCNKVK